MSIKHLVLLPFKSSLTKKEIEQVMLALADLQKAIPQILSFSWKENNSPENLHHGYLHAFFIEFATEADRKIYLEHPLHVKVVKETLLPALVNGAHSPLVFDYT